MPSNSRVKSAFAYAKQEQEEVIKLAVRQEMRRLTDRIIDRANAEIEDRFAKGLPFEINLAKAIEWMTDELERKELPDGK